MKPIRDFDIALCLLVLDCLASAPTRKNTPAVVVLRKETR